MVKRQGIRRSRLSRKLARPAHRAATHQHSIVQPHLAVPSSDGCERDLRIASFTSFREINISFMHDVGSAPSSPVRPDVYETCFISGGHMLATSGFDPDDMKLQVKYTNPHASHGACKRTLPYLEPGGRAGKYAFDQCVSERQKADTCRRMNGHSASTVRLMKAKRSCMCANALK